MLFIQVDHLTQIIPTSGGHKTLAVHRSFHLIEISLFDFQIGQNRGMHPIQICELLPHRKIRFHIYSFQSVPCGNVKLPDRAVIFRWISGSDNDPASRDFVSAEHFILQELQHDRSQCLRNAVDLVEKQNTVLNAGVFHQFIDGRDDLTHGIFGNIVLAP